MTHAATTHVRLALCAATAIAAPYMLQQARPGNGQSHSGPPAPAYRQGQRRRDKRRR
jgi:hypothetical protein